MFSEMLIYAKFLKDILTKKRKVEEGAMVSLTEECSAIVLNEPPHTPIKHGDLEYTLYQ